MTALETQHKYTYYIMQYIILHYTCNYLLHCINKPVRKCSLMAELEHQQWYRRLP